MPRPRKQSGLPWGMVKRKGRDGYYARFQVGGVRTQQFLSLSLKTATQILAELVARAQRADVGMMDNRYSLRRLRDEYLAHCRQQLAASTVACYEDWLGRVLGGINAQTVEQLTVPMLVAYRAKRSGEGAAPRTVNGEVGCLKTALNWAVRSNLIQSNPIRGLTPLPARSDPDEGRPLTDEEVGRLLAASPPHWREVWYTFLVTGMRKGELAALEFTSEFIDWTASELIIPARVAKSRKSRRIPMDATLRTIFERREAERNVRTPKARGGRKSTAAIRRKFSTSHVFTTISGTPFGRRGNLYRTFLTCLQKAGIARQTFAADGVRVLEHVDIHSLRRTFATRLITGGCDPKTVQELLGHATLDMTMRIYARVRSGTKHLAIGQLPYGSMFGKQ